MDLILKQKPEDFYVEEILPKDFFKPTTKTICLYKVEKINVSHKELENILKLKCPKINFHFAGMKDKNAHTIQYATANQKLADFEHSENNQFVKISFLQNVEKHLYAGANKENFFRIKTNYFKEYKSIPYIGTPNYFDDQRFGNDIFLDLVNAINNKDFESALKIYLTRPSLNKETNKMRTELKNNWKNLSKISEETKEKLFNQNKYKQQIFDLIIKKDYQSAFDLLNKKDIKMMVKQYQSYIWNQKLDEFISKTKYNLFSDLKFNIEKISQKEINVETLKRNAFFYAKELKQEKDKENKDLAILSFKLPKGSYATILIKHLYSLNYT